MLRQCTNCSRLFTALDLVKDESKGMEAERKALGLKGVRFLYYLCPACDFADVFIDIHPLADEPDDVFRARRAGLEDAIRHVHAEKTAVVLCER